MQYLGGMDTMFVRAETPSMLLHVTGVLVLDPGPLRAAEVRDRIRDVVTARLPALPPLRWRLVEPPGGFGALRWVQDPDFDVDAHMHLTAAPAPGATSPLEQSTSMLAARPLDRSRPLWEMHVVDGLGDGTVAVIAKFHHAFMDGGAGMDLMAELFDLTPDASLGSIEDDRPSEPLPTWWQLAASTPIEVLRRVAKFPAALGALSGLSGMVGAMFPNGDGKTTSSAARRTGFNGTLSDARAVALASCALDDAKEVAAAFNVTINDVILAAVTSSLRLALASDPSAPGPLIAAVPVSVRAAHPDERFGNHTSAMMIPLPADVADPVRRLEAVGDATRRAKAQHDTMGVELLERWAEVVPPWLISTGARVAARFELAARLPPLYNLIVSNVAGPPVPIYLGGLEVVATYPLGPLLDGVGLNVTVISQCNRIHIGILCDPALVPDPVGLGKGCTDALDELVSAAASLDHAPAGAQ